MGLGGQITDDVSAMIRVGNLKAAIQKMLRESVLIALDVSLSWLMGISQDFRFQTDNK